MKPPKIKGFANVMKRAKEKKELNDKLSISLPPGKLQALKDLKPIAAASGFSSDDIDVLLSKHVAQAIDQLWDYFRTAFQPADKKEKEVCILNESVGKPLA